MKKVSFYLVLFVGCFLFISVCTGKDLALEFQAACELESLCWTADFYGASTGETLTFWENGKMLAENEEGDVYEVPITEAVLECETLNAAIIENIMKLTHLRSLFIQFTLASQTSFPIQKLKQLVKLELWIDSENGTAIPIDWAKNIRASKTIRTLSLDFCGDPRFLSNIAKMKRLHSLTLHSDAENILPILLPLKDTLRELDLLSGSEPQAGEVLKYFTQLQVLSLECPAHEKQKIDPFLKAIRHLPLRCLWLFNGQIGFKGEKILREWKSLQEIVLPEDFPDERFASLEQIQIPVQIFQKNGSRDLEMRKKFFRNSRYNEQSRPFRLDADGNYIHWSELRGGIWVN